MKLDISTESISGNYIPIHITTFLLILFSLFIVAEELTASVFFTFLSFLCLGFYISWRYKYIKIERFNLIEYSFALFFVVILTIMFSRIDFVFEEIIRVCLNALLILGVYMVFYLLHNRRYIYLQVLSLPLFLISVILIAEKTPFYFFLVFLYTAVWFSIFRFSFLKEVREQASQVISGAVWYKRYVEWVGIVYLFLVVSLGAVFITGGINRLKPYKIGIFPSPKLGVMESGDRFGEEETDSQKLAKLMKMFDRLESLSIEDKTDTLMPFSMLFKEDLPIQEVLKALLGLIDILNRPGPGTEKSKDKAVKVFSSLNSYTKSRIRSNLQQSKDTFASNIEYEFLPRAERNKFSEISNNIDRAKAIDIVDKALAKLKEIKPAAERDTLASELYQIGLAKIAEIYVREKGSLEGIAEVAKGLKDIKKPISPEFFKEAISLDHNVSKTIEHGGLSKDEKRQLEKFKQELFRAKSRDKLGESEKFSLRYVQRLEELGKVQKKNSQVLGSSIQRFAKAKREIIHKREELYAQIESSIEPHLASINVVPNRQEVSLGKEASFKAIGTYNDSTERNISILCDWAVSEPGVASQLSGGRFNSCSTGTTFITATFEGVRSNEVKLEVVGPKIVSIEMIPVLPVVSKGDGIQLKAIGRYSDSQTEDITAKADWTVDNETICDISSTGYIKAKKRGRAYILISYQGVESIPYMLKVVPIIINPGLFIAFFTGLIALIALIFVLVIYAMNKANIRHLGEMERDEPRRYIIILYRYLNNILASYGIRRSGSVSPKAYIKQISKQWHKTITIPLTSLTEEFYIARYSSRDIESQSLPKVKEGYNKVLQIMSSSNLLWKNFFVRLRASIRIIPFSIM